jgi:transcriptional regulator with XRE-family HTH domain
MATTGKTLRLERVRADLTIIAVASEMGLSRQSLWSLERAAVVDPARAKQYRDAVERLRDVTETSDAVAS